MYPSSDMDKKVVKERMAEQEAIEISADATKIRAQYAKEMRLIAKTELLLTSESGRLIADIKEAFKKERSMSAAQKNDDYVNANTFLKVSKFIRENAGAALMVAGSAIVVLGASAIPGGLPVILGVVAVSTGTIGSAHVAWGTLSRTAAMIPIIHAQNQKVYEENLKKIKQTVTQQALERVETHYNNLPNQLYLKKSSDQILHLKNEIVRLEQREQILEKIDKILNMNELEQTNAAIASDGSDYDKFENFKKTQKKSLDELQSLVSATRQLDSAFTFKNKTPAIFDDFNAFKLHLLEMRKYTSTNIRNEAQIKSRANMLKKINDIREKLKPQRRPELVVEEMLIQTKKAVGLQQEDATIDFKKFKEQQKKEFEALEQLANATWKLGLQLDQHRHPSQEKINSFNTIDELKKYLSVLEKSIVDTEQQAIENAVSKPHSTKIQKELTALKEGLADAVEELQNFTRIKKAELEDEKIGRDKAIPEVEKKLLEQSAHTQWAKEMRVNMGHMARDMTPTALSIVHSGQVFLNMMELTSKTDTIPTSPLADVIQKANTAAVAATATLAAKNAVEGANTIVQAVEAAAARADATVASVAAAAEASVAAVQHSTGSNSNQSNGANVVSKEASAASTRRNASTASVVAAATAAAIILKSKADALEKSENSAKDELTTIQQRLTVSDLNAIRLLLSDVNEIVGVVNDSILTVAEKTLEQSTANDDIRFLDLLRLEDVCSRSDKFKPASESGMVSKLKAGVKGVMQINPEFQRIIDYLTSGYHLKETMLEIMKTNPDPIRGRAQSTPEETIITLDNALTTINSNLLDVQNEFDKQLDELQVYFPPDDNMEKRRFMLMASKEQAVFFRKILKIKQDIISVNKTFKELKPEQLEKINENEALKQKLDLLLSTAETVEKKMEAQLVKIRLSDQANERYRKPYVDVFSNLSDPSKGLNYCINSAPFSDLLFLLPDGHFKEFVIFAKDPKRHLGTDIAKEFCALYAYGVDSTTTKTKTDKLAFSKKIYALPDSQEKQKALEELKDLHQRYLVTRKPLEYPELKKITGENFSTESDFVEYIKNNEQLYHSQKVLGVQQLAITEAIQRDLKGDLNVMKEHLSSTPLKINTPEEAVASETEAPIQIHSEPTGIPEVLAALTTEEPIIMHGPVTETMEDRLATVNKELKKTSKKAMPSSEIESTKTVLFTPPVDSKLHKGLFDAIKKKDALKFEDLLAKPGVDPDATSELGSLLYVASQGNIPKQFSKLLFEKGADPNKAFRGITPVALAASLGKMDILENFIGSNNLSNKKVKQVTAETWNRAESLIRPNTPAAEKVRALIQGELAKLRDNKKLPI